ncbi:DUF2255 family protein [Microbacterium deminutum]|uniref:DUF2255 family protein n=1 Tax=Microbacterium deminutum TaxID=344164 RepID=A0ABN2QVF6_9MICO
MASFTVRELDTIGGADQLQISSRRFNGTMRPFVTIWGVRDGDHIYVRSAHGATNGWFRRAVTSGHGWIRAAGAQRRVTFDRVVDAATQQRLDIEYHRKYDKYGPLMVGPVVGPGVWAVTLRLIAE